MEYTTDPQGYCGFFVGIEQPVFKGNLPQECVFGMKQAVSRPIQILRSLSKTFATSEERRSSDALVYYVFN